MKRYGNLYGQICSLDNVTLAHTRAKRRKGHYAEVRRVDAALNRHMRELCRVLREQQFRTSDYTVEMRNDTGKERTIFVLPYYPDRVVHHAVMNVVEPIWERTLIRDTYSAIKGRGVHDGLRRLHGFLSDKPGTRYCLKMDVAKFYPTIDHGVLKQILRRTIKCGPTLALLDEIVDSAPGVPIGNYLSQYFGNLYLSAFDHWVKEQLRVRYYCRYCDDLVLFDADKVRLHELRERIQVYLAERLKLRLKSNWQVFPTAVRGVDFLGYRSFGEYTLVRKSIARKLKRALRSVSQGLGPNKLNRVMSYKGWVQHANAHRLWTAHCTDAVRGQVAAECAAKGIHNPLKAAA